MKGGGGVVGGVAPAKRRWRGLAIGVFFLVVLSMFVPLGFLLGLHNGFHSHGFVPNQSSWAGGGSSNIDDLLNKIEPKLPKDVIGNLAKKAKNITSSLNASRNSQLKKGIPVSPTVQQPPPATQQPPPTMQQPPPTKNNVRVSGKAGVTGNSKDKINESGRLCELKYGSYCLWREENREEMKDVIVKRLKDWLFVARAYFPSIAKIPAQNNLSRELKQNIQEFERILSESATDADLPSQIKKKLQSMEAAIAKAKVVPTVDCNNVDKKLRQILDMTEDEANFHMKQSAFLFQLAVHTIPKSLHCLNMRLTVEYFKNHSSDMESEKYADPTLHHFVIFSRNVLASSVVINSTVVHARESAKQVFHVLTNRQNFYAMKLWFLNNSYKDAAVEVLNIEDYNLDHHEEANLSPLFLPMEFRVSFHSVDNAGPIHNRTQYMSTFSHSHYLLPEIFKNLEKVVILDDDIVVQQDLSALWSLDMGGKVNGAVQFCSVRLGQLQSFLGESGFDKNSCSWMSGLNVIDLVRWRELALTETYWRLVREQANMGEGSALKASFLTFQDLIYALDGVWVLSGLGHDYNLRAQDIKKAAVLHYNGNMKPWLELGIPQYKARWRKFLKREHQFLSECNVNP
ncbi:hypothetical protein SLE2022_341410 [Rubroshorea leprosula]